MTGHCLSTPSPLPQAVGQAISAFRPLQPSASHGDKFCLQLDPLTSQLYPFGGIPPGRISSGFSLRKRHARQLPAVSPTPFLKDRPQKAHVEMCSGSAAVPTIFHFLRLITRPFSCSAIARSSSTNIFSSRFRGVMDSPRKRWQARISQSFRPLGCLSEGLPEALPSSPP